MAKNKGYIAAFIAGFFGILVLITPIAYHDSSLVESYIWIWGLYTWKVLLGDTTFYFSEDTDFLTWGLIATFLILIATISIISTARKASKRSRKYGTLWFLCGILFIAAPIVFYFGLTSDLPSWLTELFWDFYSLHFAFIGCFIAGIIAIIGAFTK
jgi:hypothetical protein